MIGLINDTISTEDMDALADWLKTYPRLTKGELTKQFEKEFAAWMGCKYSVFVNSGSSANLIMVYALIASKRLQPGDKVVVPALCWITDISPIIQFGLTPVLCDCNLENLSVDLQYLEDLFKSEKPKALLLVSVLGLSPDMDSLLALCKAYDVILLEDNCESLGSAYKERTLGTFGVMSTTSMYFGHHISTIEGGMVFTDDDDLYKVLLSLRSHGWSRDWSPEDTAAVEKEYNVSGINAMYTFYYPGFNVRATDLQAFIGLRQLKKLDSIISIRNRNYKLYVANINCAWCPVEIPGSYTSNFAFPLIGQKKDALVKFLTGAGIESRPLICGSMGTQPFYKELYGKKLLANCDIVDRYGIYLPNHPGMSKDDVLAICAVINSFYDGED